MTNLEHYFENLLYHGEDIKGEANKNALTEEQQKSVEQCAQYVIYSLFGTREHFNEWIKRDAASPWHRVEEELPKSGTHVLVCCEIRGLGGFRGHYVCDAFHTDPKTIKCDYDDDIDVEYDEETDEYYFPEGWWEVIKNWDDYYSIAISDFVTHWMPLPEPPKEE